MKIHDCHFRQRGSSTMDLAFSRCGAAANDTSLPAAIRGWQVSADTPLLMCRPGLFVCHSHPVGSIANQ